MDSVSTDALDWALTHVKQFGDTDFFPVPFEYDAIKHHWTAVRDYLAAIDISSHRPQSPLRFLVPKPSGSFRIATQLDPLDTLLYTAVIYEAASAVESMRIPADRQIACSYRIEPDSKGSLFKRELGWPDYHARSVSLAESGDYSFVVVADITDFYNQASQHRIENALEMASVSPERAKNTEQFLNLLTAKQSRGVPVGPSASIVLAEACLADVDSFLLRRGVDHTRYVDDFRIFCESHHDAVQILHDLSQYLYTSHRLVLNESKTKIMTVSEFCEREVLDPEEREIQGQWDLLREQFEEALEYMGPYASEEVQSFEEALEDETIKNAIRDNLRNLLSLCLNENQLHLGLAKYVLRRAAALRTNVVNSIVFQHLPRLAPIFRDTAK